MLQPKKTKFRKAFKGRIHGNAKGGTSLNFGSYGLKAMEPERITARMGKGKGSPEFWAARVKPGRILFELDGVPGPVAALAFERAAMKLPIKTKVIARLGDTSHLEG